ncbi:MAG: flagellar hook-associated protein FlgK [Bacteroidota bacterium]
MGVGRLFDISVRTMSVYQRAISVASNNISNANNPDYSRQRVVLASETSERGIGTGVKVQDITRIKNDLLDTQVRTYQSSFSDAEKRSAILKQVEAIIAEPSQSGLSNYMTEFFNSWDQLTTDPTSIQLRLNIIQKANQLSSRFKETLDGIAEVQSSLQKEAGVRVEQVNSYLREISDINKNIYQSEAAGIKASDLRDQRDALIDKLSEIVNVTVQLNDFGTATVNVAGIQGADQSGYNQLELKIVNGQMKIVSKKDPNSIAVLNGGELYAISDLYSNKVPAYKTAYEDLANVFINKVNELHQTGQTLIQGTSSSTGIPFFGDLSGGSVVNAFVDGKIQINSSILNNPKNIAASDTVNNDGNGNIANKIARLADAKIPELNNQTLLESYTTNLNNLGLEKVISDSKIESSGSVLQQLKNQKSSYSGVSLDEEMANVLKYQRSYDAAAKMVKIADQMLQTILNMV